MTPQALQKLIGVGLIVFVLVIFGSQSTYVVEPGSRGVRVTLGKVSELFVPEGLTFKLPLITEIHQVSIKQQTQQLEELQQNQQAKLKEFQSYRDSRQVITARLQAYIDEQGIQLQFLQKDEQELAKLVSELKHQELAIQVYEDMPPFTSLKGKLNWPARGKIAKQFGKLRKGGQLKWQGVTIAAKNGVEVKAITTGKVIFADWFRNMGLLLILDHGDGFMSLYGHNERLLKKAGDWVLSGEIIARVGDTGGQQKSGLYFEIRKSGNPINPNLWCKN